jgi:nucleoside-diphosphate-sugar epimerase
MRVCIVGASGKLGKYMVQHALDRGYEVVGVCRAGSVGKLGDFEGRVNIVPGATDDREVIQRAVAGCDGVLVVLVPRGVHGYASERPRRSWTTRSRGHGWCSRAGGISLVTARTCTRGSSRRS